MKKIKNNEKFNFLSILALGFFLGLITSSNILKKSEEVVPPISSKVASGPLSQEELIKKIISVSDPNPARFSEMTLNDIKAKFLAKAEYSSLTQQEEFWSNFSKHKSSEIRDLDTRYAKLTTDFYTQFSIAELQRYLKLIELPIYSNFQKILIEELENNSSNRQLYQSLEAMIKKDLPPG